VNDGENLTEKVVILDRFGLIVYLAYCYFFFFLPLLLAFLD
jgi:hypothetical protein